MAYLQCACRWQSPVSGRCECGHTEDDHDAGQCWANALDCPECRSLLWKKVDMGGLQCMRCYACGHWDPVRGNYT